MNHKHMTNKITTTHWPRLRRGWISLKCWHWVISECGDVVTSLIYCTALLHRCFTQMDLINCQQEVCILARNLETHNTLTQSHDFYQCLFCCHKSWVSSVFSSECFCQQEESGCSAGSGSDLCRGGCEQKGHSCGVHLHWECVTWGQCQVMHT